MASGFEVTKRGPKGEPREFGCTTHEKCTWRLPTPNAFSDDDAIVRAMFASHLRERGDPGRQAGGHTRRART